MKHFCCLVSLQAGCTVISVVFMTLAAVVFLVNLPHIVTSVFLMILLVWIFLILSVAVVSFMAAYLESPRAAIFTLIILALTIIYWLCISIIPIISADYKWITNLCINQRCGESLWLMTINYHGVHYMDSYSAKSSYLSGDRFINNSSILGADDDKKIIEAIHDNDSKSEDLIINLKDLSVDHHKNETGSKIDFVDNQSSTDVNEKITTLYHKDISASTSMVDGNNNHMDTLDTLFLSENGISLLNDNEIMIYYDYPKLLSESTGHSNHKTSLKVLSIIMLLLNLIFFIYSWIVIYSYWRAVGKTVRDYYETSDFGGTEYGDSTSEGTTSK